MLLADQRTPPSRTHTGPWSDVTRFLDQVYPESFITKMDDVVAMDPIRSPDGTVCLDAGAASPGTSLEVAIDVIRGLLISCRLGHETIMLLFTPLSDDRTTVRPPALSIPS